MLNSKLAFLPDKYMQHEVSPCALRDNSADQATNYLSIIRQLLGDNDSILPFE
jgi:hypothetical protein